MNEDLEETEYQHTLRNMCQFLREERRLDLWQTEFVWSCLERVNDFKYLSDKQMKVLTGLMDTTKPLRSRSVKKLNEVKLRWN